MGLPVGHSPLHSLSHLQDMHRDNIYHLSLQRPVHIIHVLSKVYPLFCPLLPLIGKYLRGMSNDSNHGQMQTTPLICNHKIFHNPHDHVIRIHIRDPQILLVLHPGYTPKMVNKDLP